MANVLVVSHGRLAAELVASARRIVGELGPVESVCLDWDAAPEAVEESLREAVERAGEPLLVLVDIHGGTPSNVAMRLARPGRIEVLSGVNLAMVVRLGCAGALERPVGELAEWIRGKGRDSICHPRPAGDRDEPCGDGGDDGRA